MPPPSPRETCPSPTSPPRARPPWPSPPTAGTPPAASPTDGAVSAAATRRAGLFRPVGPPTVRLARSSHRRAFCAVGGVGRAGQQRREPTAEVLPGPGGLHERPAGGAHVPRPV